MSIKKLSIGTANFSKNYGRVSNSKISLSEIKKILLFSEKKKINFLDTALNYKNTGTLENFKINKWNIITKINCNISNKKKYLINLKKKLNISNFYCVLIHLKNEKEILSKKNINFYNLLADLKKKEVIKKIGFSVYSPLDVKLILKHFEIDLLQCPINIFDTRLIDQDLLKKIKKKKVEIHARSVFLQGALLKDFDDLPINFKPWKNIFKIWDDYVKNLNVSKLEACIGFVKQFKEIDKIIVGIENVKQLNQIYTALNKKKKLNLKNINFKKDRNFIKLIDPRKWN